MLNKHIIIVGAGINGLTIAYELARRGYKVIVIEKEDSVGGLARSFKYNGFTFDIGPHRFYTINSATLQFIKNILGNESMSIYRHTAVRVLGRYYNWPLRPTALLKLPLNIMIKSGIDLLFKMPKKSASEDSFRDYICNSYGVTIYEVFFRKYTEKFLGLSANEVHSDWAKASMDKAVIDKRIVLRNLFDILRLIIMPIPIRTEFFYPKRGIGSFSKKLAEGIKQREGIILTGAPVTNIEYSKDEIVSVSCGEITLRSDRLIWTAPIVTLYGFLGFSPLNLDYLSLILFNIELSKPLKNNHQWCYYGDDEVIFNRVSFPLLFSKNLIPDGRASLCVELTCRQNDQRWNRAEELIDQVKRDLIKVNVIKKIEDIVSVHIERIPHAYPIYKLGYHQQIYKTKQNLRKFKNLTLAGRTGLFWFNNMDESIENGLAVAGDVAENQ